MTSQGMASSLTSQTSQERLVSGPTPSFEPGHEFASVLPS